MKQAELAIPEGLQTLDDPESATQPICALSLAESPGAGSTVKVLVGND
jgi:hypothetical protein